MPKAVGKGWGRGSVPPGEALLPEDSLQMCTCMYTPHACTDRRARTPHTLTLVCTTHTDADKCVDTRTHTDMYTYTDNRAHTCG